MSKRQIELRTMPYDEYLKTPEWIAIRDQALERDGHRCRFCDSGKDLNVHHRTYARRGNEDLNDLTTLLQSAADAGDMVMLRQHQQRLLFIHQQLRVLNNAVQGRQS